MMRILLDECLPVKLKYRFQEINPDFRVSTVTHQKWTGLKNGELLEKAQQKFEVFVTIDQNLPHQQVLSKYSIAIIALKANSNRYMDLLEFVEPVCQAVTTLDKGKYYEIDPPNKQT